MTLADESRIKNYVRKFTKTLGIQGDDLWHVAYYYVADGKKCEFRRYYSKAEAEADIYNMAVYVNQCRNTLYRPQIDEEADESEEISAYIYEDVNISSEQLESQRLRTKLLMGNGTDFSEFRSD
jgi:hypothetical protein